MYKFSFFSFQLAIKEGPFSDSPRLEAVECDWHTSYVEESPQATRCLMTSLDNRILLMKYTNTYYTKTMGSFCSRIYNMAITELGLVQIYSSLDPYT